MQIAALTGLAIGDALGAPFEFLTHEEITKAVEEKRWNFEYQETSIWSNKTLKPGQYTDDTLMALALSKSLKEHKQYSIIRTSKKYLEWYESGDLRGIGTQTSKALNRLKAGVSPYGKSGEVSQEKGLFIRKNWKRDPSHCGNGTAMRIAPLGVFYRKYPELIKMHAEDDAIITHDHPTAEDASFAVAYLTALLAEGELAENAVQQVIGALLNNNSLVKKSLKQAWELSREDRFHHGFGLSMNSWEDALVLGTDGTAHETVGSAVFCFLHYYDMGFRDVVVNAIRMGGDTDTRAAIAGAFAGAYFGLENIPKNYLEGLENLNHIKRLDKFLARGYNGEIDS